MFQDRINANPAPAVKGDFADANFRATVVAGAGALVAAGEDTVGATVVDRRPIVGNFAWGDQVSGEAFSRYFGETTAKIGFVHREGQAIIVPFLAEKEMSLEPGFVATLMNQGSFWAEFVAGSTVGQKVFANYLDGSVYSAATGTSTQTVSAMTGAIVGATGVLTVASITGTLHVGDVLTGTPITEPVAVVAQLSGTIGGIGTYQTTATANVADVTGTTANSGIETDFVVDSTALVDAHVTADLATTGVLTVSALGTRIVGFVSGTGGTGTYLTNVRGLVLTSRAMVASNGHLAKISTWS
jgi:hypothetical protein